jgi:hypothetical protein
MAPVCDEVPATELSPSPAAATDSDGLHSRSMFLLFDSTAAISSRGKALYRRIGTKDN